MITIDEILKDWESDCQLDQVALDESSIKFARIHQKYLSRLSESRLSVKSLESKMANVRKDKWLYYTGKMTKGEMDKRGWKYDPFDGMSHPLKSDLQMFIDTDQEMQTLSAKLEYQKNMSDVLTEILDTLRWRHSVVKNVLAFRQFAAGN